jgi:hypothetical protein
VNAHYESPKLSQVGSVLGLTMGAGILGADDNFVFHIGSITIDIPYGHGS